MTSYQPANQQGSAPSIAPGGCYPPDWPWPEPEPDSLDQTVNWMTWEHRELYRMVHEGVDTSQAGTVAAKWAWMGDELAEIGDELQRLAQATAQAWEGDAAELTRRSVAALSEWSKETGVRATDVCGCVTREVEAVSTARDTMPPPQPYLELPTPQPEPVPFPQPGEVEAFTGNGFATAPDIVADPNPVTQRDRELHEQAARVMQRFQVESREIYGTVPQFAQPLLNELPSGPDGRPQPPQPKPQPTQPQGSGGGGMPVPGGFGGNTGGTTPPTIGPRAGAVPAQAGSSAAGEQPGASRPAAASTSGRGTGMPMMPMGMGAGGAGGQDDTHKTSSYLQEDNSLWGEPPVVTPPVLGDE